MKKPIVFIHGMFQNAKSWDKWVSHFNTLGFHCIAPSWPLHEGEPANLRKNVPPGLGDLVLDDLVLAMEQVVQGLDSKPIIIGHSVGGLIAQLLASKGMAELAIPISPVAPNMMLSFDWGFFKNSISIANPFKGDEPFFMTPEGFHGSFANALPEAESNKAFEQTATHDSRNVLRSCMGASGHIDLSLPHVPMLFIAAENDEIVPASLVEKNSKAYSDENSVVEYREFQGRSHYICGEPNWQEVAETVHQFITRQGQVMVGGNVAVPMDK